MPDEITRRGALGVLGMAAAGVAAIQPGVALAQGGRLKNNLKHSACRWCYQKMELEALCEQAAGIGLQSIELLDVDELAVPPKYGMTCAMVNGSSGIGRGWNRADDHKKLIDTSKELITKIAEAGCEKMIVFSGNTPRGQSPEEGIDACAAGLSKIMKTAEKHGVTVCMELLNSKVDHRGYQCDHTPWGVALVDKIGHPNFRLLYDIYHMQIMEGDVIRTIQDYGADYFAHYHTGGVPGRHEIDDSQELNYSAVSRAIVETGYSGFLAQEFIPTKDPMTALAEAVQICDV